MHSCQKKYEKEMKKDKELFGNKSIVSKAYKYIFGRARCPVSSLWILSSCITRMEKNIFLYFFLLEICSQWYFVTKIVLTYCEKKMFYWSRKTFEIGGWRLGLCKNFEIPRAIYSNSERSGQFQKQNTILTNSWRVLKYNTLEQS